MSETPKNNSNQEQKNPQSPEQQAARETEARLDSLYNKNKSEIILQTANEVIQRYKDEDWDKRLREAAIRKVDTDLLDRTKQLHESLQKKIEEDATAYEISIVTNRLVSAMSLVSHEQCEGAKTRVAEGDVDSADTLWNALDELYVHYEENRDGKRVPQRGSDVLKLRKMPNTRTWEVLHRGKVVAVAEPLRGGYIEYRLSSDTKGKSYQNDWETAGFGILRWHQKELSLKTLKTAPVGQAADTNLFPGVRLSIQTYTAYSKYQILLTVDSEIWGKFQSFNLAGVRTTTESPKIDSIIQLDSGKYGLLSDGVMKGFVSFEVQKDGRVKIYTRMNETRQVFQIMRPIDRK